MGSGTVAATMVRPPLARARPLLAGRLTTCLRSAGVLGLGVLVVLAGGCSHAWPVLRELARPEQTVVSPPGEDGTRYLAVEGGPLASPAALRSRWGVVARQVCEGEYIKLAESTASRRQGGTTRSRIHEGYIRCLLPDEREPGDGPTVAEAEADASPKPPRRARRANLARTGWTR